MHGYMAKEREKIVGCQARVLNPYRLTVIYATNKKTDKEDALKRAHLVTDRPDNRLPAVAISSDEEMERRKLVSSYLREQKAWTQGINRLHGTYVHAGITTVVKKELATDEARREADPLLKCLELHEARIERLETVPGQ
jgi:hypothetical protein